MLAPRRPAGHGPGRDRRRVADLRDTPIERGGVLAIGERVVQPVPLEVAGEAAPSVPRGRATSGP